MRLTQDEFIEILQEELDLPLQPGDLDGDLDAVVHWDSMHVLTLVREIERQTSRRVLVGRVMMARTLQEIYQAVAE